MMLMLVAVHKDESNEVWPWADGVALGLRFFESEEGAGRVEKRLKIQVRKRFPGIDPKKVEYHVYKPSTTNAGWPKWLGESAYYK